MDAGGNPMEGSRGQADPGTGADVIERVVRGATHGTGTSISLEMSRMPAVMVTAASTGTHTHTGTGHTPHATGMAGADPGAEPGALVRGT